MMIPEINIPIPLSTFPTYIWPRPSRANIPPINAMSAANIPPINAMSAAVQDFCRVVGLQLIYYM